MAAIVYNVSKNNIDISDLRVALVQGYTPNADHATLAAILASAGCSECTFTNYVRKALTTEAFSVDNSGDLGKLDADDPSVWASAGGATNNTVSHAIVYAYAAADADCIPVSCHDVGLPTNGGDLDIDLNSAGIMTTA